MYATLSSYSMIEVSMLEDNQMFLEYVESLVSTTHILDLLQKLQVFQHDQTNVYFVDLHGIIILSHVKR